ncbi:phage tail tape measure protein [Paenibacillus profundus]|uniref:Phage tail tape measure protein n=1 Tax=Paenibacillus profundus TaxID=1173085 RepID=A0ABS8YCC8_9BACL|nr:phage tail tape measure protein [Paenibacillus profundus]MCE5168529.1 phage tail tape measure protein [Paenibacillus profundus]
MSLRKMTVDVGYNISTSPLESLDKRLNKLSGTNSKVFDRMEMSMGKAGKAMQGVASKSGAMASTVSKSQAATEQAAKAADKATVANDRMTKAAERLQKANDAAAKATERARAATARAAEVAAVSTSSQDKVTKAMQRAHAANEKAITTAVRAQKADEKFRIAQEAAAAAGNRVKQASTGVSQAVDRQSKAVQRAAKEVDQLRKKYGEFSNGSLKALDKIDQASGNIRSAGVAMGAAGGLLSAGIGSSIKLAADFESSMSRVGALSGATGDEMKRLSDTAKKLGAETVFTSSQAAEGMQYLSMAGFKTNDMIEAMPGLLDTAAAGQIDLGRAADITSNILTGFGVAAKDTSKVADILTATFTNSNTDLNMLGDTMKYIAPIAKASGQSLEEMAAATAMLGNAGIQGSEAGTALRASMIRLAKPPTQAAKVLDQLGVSIADQSGKVLPLSNVVGQFVEKTKGLTDAQRLAAVSTVVGTEAASAFLALMDSGQPALEGFRASLEKSGGVAKNIADRQLDNLNGAMEKVNSAMEGAKLAMGDTFIPILTDAATFINKLVDAFNGLPDGAKKAIAIFTAIAGAVLLLGGALTVLVSFIPNVVAGFKMLSAVRPLIMGLSGPMLGVIAAVAAVAAAVYLIIKYWKPITAFFKKLWGSITKVFSSTWKAITGFLTDTWNAIKTTAVSLWNGIVSTVMAIIAPFIDNIKASFERIKNGVTTIFEGLKLYFSGAWQVIKNIFLGAILLITDLFTGNFSGMKEHAIQIWNNIKGALGKVWEGIKMIFSGALEAVGGYLTMGWETMKTATEIAWNGMKTFFSDTWNGIKNLAGTIWDAMIESIQKALDWVANLPGRMLQYGKDAINGFVDGIKNAANAVGDSVTNVANNVTNGIKDALDIRSPSRVMKELGRFTTEGFTIGIQDKIPEISHAINSMATATTTPEAPQPEQQGLAPAYSHNSVQSKNVIAPKIEITIQGGDGTSAAKDVAREVKKEMENLFRSFGMKNPQFIEG